MDCAHRIALYLSIQYRVLFVDFVSGYTYSSAVRGVYTSTRDGVCTIRTSTVPVLAWCVFVRLTTRETGPLDRTGHGYIET